MSLHIRRAITEDAAAFARILGDAAVYPNLMQVPYTNEAIWRARLTEMSAPAKGDLLLVAERVVDGKAVVVGSSGLHPLSALPRLRHSALLGISVAPEAQGKGVGTALMQAMCDFADRWMQVQRIQLDVYTDNTAAIALYRKFGFETEATQRGYALRDGAYVDSHCMARLHPNPPVLPQPAVRVERPSSPPAAAQRGTASGHWTLRSYDATDADAVAALMTRHGVVEELAHTPWAPVDTVREQIAKASHDLALVALTQGRVIGHASLAVAPALRRRHAATVSVCVAPEWQGQGVGTALVAAAVDWAEGWAGLLRLETSAPAGNEGALALLRKFCFEVEGTQRAALLRDGAFVDRLMMARLHANPPRPAAPSAA